MYRIEVSTQKRTQLKDITADVEAVVRKAAPGNALVTIFVPHTTAGVTINENADPTVPLDMLNVVDSVIPFDANYRHMEGNSAAHIKSSLFGCSLQVICENGQLQLGTWQGIYFAEFDGPRRRQVWVAFSPLIG